MTIALGHRADDLVERMDDPQCDLALLERTYRDFRHVNALISGWHGIYRRRIRPVLQRSVDPTLLDIGFGGGDIPRRIEQWAERDGIPVRITAVDPDPRAFAFAIAGPPTAVHFRELATDDLVRTGERFDVVVSNHVLHHLDGTLGPLLADSRRLARHLVVHGDIERSRWAYGAYSALTLPLARHSFVREDGLLSIRRSYRARELAAIVGDGWRVERRFPARLLLVHENPRHDDPEGMPR